MKKTTSTNPEIRYSFGSDVAFLLYARKKMSDAEFEAFMKLNFLEAKKVLEKKGGEM